ncbi:MAG: type I-B CRISPR-associated endonuclease Cas1b [Candidatus ainarchaeum sp.]|nr:type I-B CRISPR-associated endonuclease Cas1b [Candidatus ainarchaeum sp.]
MLNIDLYITSSGELSKKDESLLFQNIAIKKHFPIKNIDSIYAFGEISINSKLLIFLSKMSIPIYFYNYYGFYSGMFAPKEQNLSGRILVEQVKHYDNLDQRLFLAKEIVNSSIHNMRKTLMQYELKEESEKINQFEINSAKSIFEILGNEANAKKLYYTCFNKILKDENYTFVKRVKRAPDNFINCLISFGNSLLYTSCLSELLKTQLNPCISYLHEPFERRYSLNLDIADIFKPLIVDRIIFTLVNQKMLNEKHFDKNLDFCYLNKEGRDIFVKEYDKKMKTTLKYPGLNRNVSYQQMLKLEGYKLIKHLLNEKDYKGFRIYW